MKLALESQLELLEIAIYDFLKHQADENKFDALDWLIQVAYSKWNLYATERRIERYKCESQG